MEKFDRRAVMVGATAMAILPLTGCVANGEMPIPLPPASFVTRVGTSFMLAGKPYRFAGANIWYGA